jgi:hypothetical protein
MVNGLLTEEIIASPKSFLAECSSTFKTEQFISYIPINEDLWRLI